MISMLARSLVAAALLGLSQLASAATSAIDLFTVTGVPGTGGYVTVQGPCYCDQEAYFSPVMLLAPGTYDFGKVRDYWVLSGPTPDAGPDQLYLYVLFEPVEVSGTYPDAFPPPATAVFPAGSAFCGQDDAACNASFDGAYVDVHLLFTVPPGQNAAQIGLVGDYRYTAPLPEPATSALLLLGLTLSAGIARRRGRR
ncbi:MAG: PEP-CTERM sorting domain-containing protein [Burkholderia ambifaria]